MVDRMGYLQSIDINGKDYSTTIVNSFDQLMGLYNISNAKYDVSILNSKCDKCLSLSMGFYEESVATSVYDILKSNKVMDIYSRKFNVEAQRISPIRIDLYMTEVV